jgi:hypothetical protein
MLFELTNFRPMIFDNEMPKKSEINNTIKTRALSPGFL